jgi:iron complex outermembrane receptor protein
VKSPRRALLTLAIASAVVQPALGQDGANHDSMPDGSKARQLDTVEVRGERPRYLPSETAAGSKIALDVKEVPQAMTVLDADALRDLAPRVLDEVADYVAGVDREAVQGNPFGISFYIRGFNTAGGATTVNGFRDYGFNTPVSAVNIERIEFLKGPSSVLYGSGALSGLVNLVTKQPQATSSHTLEARVGSFDHVAASLDSTGPLGDSGRVRYRLTAEVNDGGNFVDDTEQQSRFLSPYLSVDLSEDTTLDVELIVQDADRPGREPYFIRHPDFLRIPVTSQLGDPSHPDGDGGALTRYSGRVELRHAFGNGMQFRQAVYANNVRSDDSTIQPTSYNPVTRLLSRRVRAVDEYQRERYSQTELSGDATWGATEHRWLAGVELGKQTTGYIFRVAPFTPVDIFDPQPGERLGDLVVPFPASDSRADTTAVYVQDLVTLGGGFKAMVGARWDRLESSTGDRGATPSRTKDSKFSPRVGLIYDANDNHAIYASWNRSFRPNLGRSATGASFDPQHGRQVELGWKGRIGDRLSLTAAVFDYRRQNVLTADPNDPNFRITVGEQRSRGFELEAMGTIVDGWQMIASYGYLDAEITRDNTLPVGDRLTGAPEHTIGLFNRVDLGIEGLSATLGVAYASARTSGIPNDPAGALTEADVELPSYTKVDAGLIYARGDVEWRLVGRNLTDERIYDGYISTFQPRAPRSWEVSVAWKF